MPIEGLVAIRRYFGQRFIRCRLKVFRSVLAVANNEAVRVGGSNGLERLTTGPK